MAFVQLNLPGLHIKELQRLTVAAKQCVATFAMDEAHVDHFVEVKAVAGRLLKSETLVERAFSYLLLTEVVHKQVLVHIDHDKLAVAALISFHAGWALPVLHEDDLAGNVVLLNEGSLHGGQVDDDEFAGCACCG